MQLLEKVIIIIVSLFTISGCSKTPKDTIKLSKDVRFVFYAYDRQTEGDFIQYYDNEKIKTIDKTDGRSTIYGSVEYPIFRNFKEISYSKIIKDDSGKFFSELYFYDLIKSKLLKKTNVDDSFFTLSIDYQFLNENMLVALSQYKESGKIYYALVLYDLNNKSYEILEKWDKKEHSVLAMDLAPNKEFVVLSYRADESLKDKKINKGLIKYNLKDRKIEYISTGNVGVLGYAIQILPDNENVLFVGGTGFNQVGNSYFLVQDIIKFNLRTKKMETIVKSVGQSCHMYLMPDGQHLVYRKTDEFVIRNLVTGKEVDFKKFFGIDIGDDYIHSIDFYDPKKSV